MTIPLQIGDIVRINAPTPEETSILSEIWDTITDNYIGKLAVIIDIEHRSNSFVTVVPCDENFELTIDGISELVDRVSGQQSQGEQGEMTGVATQLTLVREGLLRSCIISEEFPQPLGGSHIPFVGTTTSAEFTAFGTYSQNTIVAGSFISRIGLLREGLFIDFTNDGDWIRMTNITTDIIQIPRAFTTF